MKKICVALLMLGNVCAVSALTTNASAHNLLTSAVNQFLLADNDDQGQNADASNNQPTDQDYNNSNADQNNDQNDQSDDQMDNNSDND